MSKYDPLWQYLNQDGGAKIILTFDEIKSALGFEIDHSFLNYKKELAAFGYTVRKISLKEKCVVFEKMQ
jgi:hypothetical protein